MLPQSGQYRHSKRENYIKGTVPIRLGLGDIHKHCDYYWWFIDGFYIQWFVWLNKYALRV